MTKWACHLNAYDIRYEARTSVKGQALADFVAEFTGVERSILSSGSEAGNTWLMHADGAANKKGSGLGIVLRSPHGEVIEQSVQLGFRATNNEAEYEAVISGLKTAKSLGVKRIIVHTDSQLVSSQINGEFLARDERMASYVTLATGILATFEHYKVVDVNRTENTHADALATLASVIGDKKERAINVEYVPMPSIQTKPRVNTITGAQTKPSWMDAVIAYHHSGDLPNDKKEAVLIKRKALGFWLDPNLKLYKRSFSGPYLLCVHPDMVIKVMEEIHEGTCGSHTGGRSLANRALTYGYWWPRMQKDSKLFVLKCDKCQRFAPVPKAPAMEMNSVTSPWPFAQWGMDIVGPFPIAPGGRKYLLMVTDYFSKWVEAVALAKITEAEVIKFLWRDVITRFGIPYSIVADNGTQFTGVKLRALYAKYEIKNFYSTPSYPQCNGQAEVSNKTVVDGIKKRLDDSKGLWAEELHHVLWAYRTTKRRGTQQTPYSLTYGMEAVIPLEIGLPTLRTDIVESGLNNEVIERELDYATEKRELASIRNAEYKNVIGRSYNKRVNDRRFQIGELVLRKVNNNTRIPSDGKLSPNWEGPYRILKTIGNGAYLLGRLPNDNPLERPWNANNLRKFYQ